jgi:phosphatidylglycerol---prolipoprotein diacylglyceryl transferase
MLPVLHLGPVAVQTPGLIILLGVWLGLMLVERQARIFQVNGKTLSDLVFLGLIAGVVGARLAFVIQYSSAFKANPVSVLSLNLALFDPVWGIVLGFVIAGLYGLRKHIPGLPALDALTSSLAVFAISFHLAQLASGDGFGAPSNLPWAIELWGVRRQPTQIYEALAAIGILWIVWPRPTWLNIPGQRFCVFIAMSSGVRLFLEAFRGDSILWGGFRSAQVIAWLVLAVSLWIMSRLKAKPNG